MAAVSQPGISTSSNAVCVEFDGRSFYVVHGHRLTIGSSRNCDIVLSGPGVAPKHATLSLRIDGRLFLKPHDEQLVRIGDRRCQRATAIDAGEPLGIGLAMLQTEYVENNLALQSKLAVQDWRKRVHTGIARAPWFLLSIAFHIGLLLLLWMMWSRTGGPEDGTGSVLIAANTDSVDDGDDDTLIEEEMTPVEEPELPEPELPDDELPAMAEAEEDAGELAPGIGSEGVDDALARTLLDAGDGAGQRPTRKIPGGISKKFAKTISKLRETGLEVALLFDSTSSMGELLAQAKEDLLDIYLMFEELVPSTRMALLTFRDRGDEYVTRNTRLGASHYEALAFLSHVRADGGGDFEEALDAALEGARKMRWRSKTRKIVVLVGDAPPHEQRLRYCERIARQMSRKNGQVHCLVIGKERETWRSMRRIARAGGGRCLGREQRTELATQLLALALGPDSDRDLRKLMRERSNASQRRRSGPRSSRLPAPSILSRALTSTRPDRAVVEAWTWAEPERLGELAPLLAKTRLSREGLQALYYIVNRSLERNSAFTPGVVPEVKRLLRPGLPKQLRRRLEALRRDRSPGIRARRRRGR